MKRSINIFRMLTCVFISLYTLLLCAYACYSARQECAVLTQTPEGAYTLVQGPITSGAWIYIISGIVLILLGATAIVFLFRKGLPSAVIAACATVASALYGLCLNTALSELVLWREPFRKIGIQPQMRTNLILSTKPSIARLCLAFAICYIVLFVVEYRKSKKHQLQSDEAQLNSNNEA